MFGYIAIYEPELKMKDYRKYRAYYCGLCQTLKKRYGSIGQMTLSYDMTFVVLLLNSLYEYEVTKTEGRCKVHPLKKRPILQSTATEYAADMNMVLSYYHLKDDWEDERKLKSAFGTAVLKRKIRKLEQKYPRQCRVIATELGQISRYEKENSTEIDEISGCFGRIMGEVLVCREDQWEKRLRRLGFFLGKYIYLMDAYEDLEKDLEKGLYNPLKDLKNRPDYEEYCKNMLCMMIAECSAEFEGLPCLQDGDILRNILYEGVWNRYRKMHLNQEKDGHLPENKV